MLLVGFTKMRLLTVCAFVFIQLFIVVVCNPIENSGFKESVIYTVEVKIDNGICKDEDAKLWSYDFHNCFIDRKANDGGKDLNNIVDRILDHSKDCIQNSTKECRPNHEGFMVIMNEVIDEMKDFSFMYLESIIHERDKVKDLECVEKVLLAKTYKKCFKNVLQNEIRGRSPERFRRDVENAISCTNEVNKKCSKEAKTDLNQMVRNILHVRQPEKENIEDDPKPEPPPPMRWYDYIFQPFISAWKTVKSWFGW